MRTPAEIFRESLKIDGKPERMLKQYEAFEFIFGDPCNAYLRGNRVKGSTSVDRWGTTILFPEDAPGPTPHITDELKVCKDITRWREYVRAPDLIANCSEGWEPFRKRCEEARENGKIPIILWGTGIFEQAHFLMGIPDTLTNLYEHPKEMHELIDYIFEYRMQYLKMLVENMHPDAILSHDDWGTNAALFMQPDLWREFFKEPYRKLYKYMRDNDVIVIHHADSYLVPIIEDMIEIGVQVWQGVLPENDIPRLQDQIKGRMVLFGGFGAAIDRADSTEEEIYEYVTKGLDEYCPRGGFVPCITYGAPGSVFPHVDPVINRAIDDYNSRLHIHQYRPAKPVRRNLQSADKVEVISKATVSDDGPILDRIAGAIKKGQKAKVLKLSQQAIEEGTPAQQILSDGLIKGMSQLGDEFSANKAFVPEMLMAAKCMSAATEMLKPHLVGEGSETIGKACIGTVKGDMHDIGKNLVKIMLEGSGIDVIDLGTDVSAEIFIDTAARENCDLIVCSSLLTTTMPEMRRVVELAKDKGIRDSIKIFVGGSPVTQEFADEIGADIYTDDAASASRAAVAALANRKEKQ